MHSKYFDQIYLVNLRQHRGRLLRTLDHLGNFGIKPVVFEATDGGIPPVLTEYEKYNKRALGSLDYFSDFNEMEVKRNQHFIESAGAYGCINTFIRVLKDAKLNGYKSILIFEDDVLLSKTFNSSLDKFYSKLPDSWKFLGLGASQYNWESVDFKKVNKEGFYTPKQLDTCGAFAIAIRDSIFDELIELQNYYEAPIDHLPLGEIYNKYPSDCFVVFPYLVMPDVRSSSIRGSRNQLEHSKKMKWDLSLFEYPLNRPILNIILTSKQQSKYLSSFDDDNTFPFELHIFFPSTDGLRPYHDSSQKMELELDKEIFISPNSGYCVYFSKEYPITEKALLSLYEALITNEDLPDDVRLIKTKTHKVDRDRVSVIIPTYRRPNNLEKCVKSVINQDYENKEIIIVDDNPKGSQDQIQTENIISNIKEKNLEIEINYIKHDKHRNGAAARNTGFLKSKGNYICFLDDDDIYLPGRLSLSVEKLKDTPRNIGGAYCGYIGWNSSKNDKKRYAKTHLTEELLSLDFLSHFLHTNTATYKRDAVIMVNGFDETFVRHQDLEFNLRFFEHYEMSVIPVQLVSLRPEKVVNSNRQSGINLFETKVKFLKKFEYIINRYNISTQKRIYFNHWAEVINNTPDKNSFQNFLLSKYGDGYIQCYSIIEKERIEKEQQLKQKIKNIKYISKIKNNDKVTIECKNELKPQKVEKVEKISYKVKSNSGNLNSWQLYGTKLFGFAFGQFILPHHKKKLRDQPKEFFMDSSNKFTQLVGKLLKIT